LISSQATETPSIFSHGRAVVVCHSWGLDRIRLLSVSRRWTFDPAYASGKWNVAAWCSEKSPSLSGCAGLPKKNSSVARMSFFDGAKVASW